MQADLISGSSLDKTDNRTSTIAQASPESPEKRFSPAWRW
jgi:hypothetical protein